MRNSTAKQSTSLHEFEKVTISPDLRAAANDEVELKKISMDTNEAIAVSEMVDRQPNNDNGHILTLKRRDVSYQSAYEAGLASGKEVGYQRGYREGFSDGCKLGNPASGTTATADMPIAVSKKSADKRASRLRGLPCANCGCASYSDEAQCPCCGTPKAPAAAKGSHQ
jgi:hypothetical protein